MATSSTFAPFDLVLVECTECGNQAIGPISLVHICPKEGAEGGGNSTTGKAFGVRGQLEQTPIHWASHALEHEYLAQHVDSQQLRRVNARECLEQATADLLRLGWGPILPPNWRSLELPDVLVEAGATSDWVLASAIGIALANAPGHDELERRADLLDSTYSWRTYLEGIDLSGDALPISRCPEPDCAYVRPYRRPTHDCIDSNGSTILNAKGTSSRKRSRTVQVGAIASFHDLPSKLKSLAFASFITAKNHLAVKPELFAWVAGADQPSSTATVSVLSPGWGRLDKLGGPEFLAIRPPVAAAKIRRAEKLKTQEAESSAAGPSRSRDGLDVFALTGVPVQNAGVSSRTASGVHNRSDDRKPQQAQRSAIARTQVLPPKPFIGALSPTKAISWLALSSTFEPFRFHIFMCHRCGGTAIGPANITHSCGVVGGPNVAQLDIVWAGEGLTVDYLAQAVDKFVVRVNTSSLIERSIDKLTDLGWLSVLSPSWKSYAYPDVLVDRSASHEWVLANALGIILQRCPGHPALEKHLERIGGFESIKSYLASLNLDNTSFSIWRCSSRDCAFIRSEFSDDEHFCFGAEGRPIKDALGAPRHKSKMVLVARIDHFHDLPTRIKTHAWASFVTAANKLEVDGRLFQWPSSTVWPAPSTWDGMPPSWDGNFIVRVPALVSPQFGPVTEQRSRTKHPLSAAPISATRPASESRRAGGVSQGPSTSKRRRI